MSSKSHLETLDHIVIAVDDLEGALEDYSILMGRAAAWRGSHPGQGTANALFPLDNSYVELLTPSGDGPVGDLLRQRLDRGGEGLAALAFGTRDAAGFADAIWDAGIRIGAPEDGSGRESSSAAERVWRTVMLPLEATRGVLTFAIEHESPPLEAAALAVAPEGAPSAVDHVVVMSADVEATMQVYRDTLGLRLALDREFPDRGLRLVFFRVGGVTVELGGRLGGSEAPDTDDTLWGVAYRVGDVEASRARLLESGLDVTAVRTGQKKGTRVCTVRDRTHGVATLLIGAEVADG